MWDDFRGDERVERSRLFATSVRTSITLWLTERREDQRFARFKTHFDVLQTVLTAMLDAIDVELTEISDDQRSVGIVYERCRAADNRLGLVRRTHEWYATKYDQRADARLADTMRAADEVVRSCWREPFRGPVVPTGPLAYLDARFDASATPRVSVPADLRAPADRVVGQFVRELPIPLIALPANCEIDPWWMVLVAHETGHHVQYDFAGAEQATRDALVAATTTPAGDDELAAAWNGWAREVFADAYAVLMVGTAAAWAVHELQFGQLTNLVVAPAVGDRYPPPAVRIALLGELARRLGLEEPGPSADDVLAWLETLDDQAVPPQARAAVSAHLNVTEAAAGALIDLPIGGRTLRELCSWNPQAFKAGGEAHRWEQQLTRTNPQLSQRKTRSAARLGIAAGVRAYRSTPAGEGRDRLRANLTSTLATCGEPGYLTGEPPLDVDSVAIRLTQTLLEAVPDQTGGG